MLEAILDIFGYWLYEVYKDSDHGTTRKILAALGMLILIGGLLAWAYFKWWR